ncbi:EAL domain-containing protein [Undibacterium sp. Jales W-56]|uniref:EAL domain-containing protein n=1 Tax=Undibacterium sp. Jales W-56 TaxID=2897325 RepID=UPI0021D30BB4|nr:EAL domain-containing protein [Undibacterium sp. Jales W-56]MCU6433519.1 EAL domain-containing protein [Undibacterium sp. Jales W-56]
MANQIDYNAKIKDILESHKSNETTLLKRLSFLEFEQRDAESLADLGKKISPYREKLLRILSEHIKSAPQLNQLLAPSDYEELDECHRLYFSLLTEGNYDKTYLHNRLNSAVKQQNLHLSHEWYLGIYRKYLSEATSLAWEISEHDFSLFSSYIEALIKLAFFDIGLTLDVYFYTEKCKLEEAKKAQEQLQKEFLFQQKHDELTGLPNRSLLKDRTKQAIYSADRKATTVALLHLGLDHFKLVNDGVGYGTGDQLLKNIAERLHQCVHEADTVSYYGGDEFVLILKDFEKTENIINVCERISCVIAEPYLANNIELHLSCSIGIALYPQDSSNDDDLFTFADLALNRAKHLGRSNFQFYSAKMNEITKDRVEISNDLHKAIIAEELSLHYQPKADLQTGKIVGMEALLRWDHPNRGMIPPTYFIPIAEESGLIEKLGDWVIKQVCRDIAAWTKDGVIAPCIAINVSPRQLQNPFFTTKLLNILKDMQIGHDMISLEVTESVLMDHSSPVGNTLKGFKEHGIALALDDFGTGYSALSYLKHFPFDYVKIDQSFVRDVIENTGDASISKAVIAMAHSLGIKVIAEGVETEAQCEFLSLNMCDQIQGYLLSRPMPADQAKEFLQSEICLKNHLLRLEKPQRSLLLVDDEPNILSSVKRLLRRDGYQIYTANSGQEGLKLLSENKVDVIVSDQRMPEMTGVEFLRNAKKLYPDTIRIVLSGYTELQSITDAINEGAIYKFLTKPWEDEQLREQIAEAFRHKEMADENRRLHIQIQTTNQELATANRYLADVLKQKQLQIKRDETSLEIVREVLQYIPVPLVGIDDNDMIAFINQAAEVLLEKSPPMLGEDIRLLSEDFSVSLKTYAAGEDFQISIEGHDFIVNWKMMGERSQSSGKLITLRIAD